MSSTSDSHPKLIGSYPVERELGKGGMGVVYLARDNRLDRPVAIKVLPQELARDPEFLSRFEREAKTLASVNHPNIATIFGLEEAEDGSRFLVLEFIEGETLGNRLKKGLLPLEDALRIGLQIAEAVKAAHERGVIHRDLKPDNVMLLPGKRVKLLDFGLAKPAVAPLTGGQTDVETVKSSWVGSEAGRVMGTPGYFSPEQARGQSLDKRTDIFAFGCVLFECLAGGRIFAGDTAVDLIAAILTQEPDWSRLSPDTPEGIQALLAGCLTKDHDKRWDDIGRVCLQIEEALGTGMSPSLRAPLAEQVPNNLPRKLTSFVGRETETEDVKSMLATASHVTLTGVGGCGKTRLALELARRLMSKYPEGVWFVELAPIKDPDRVPHVVAATVGLQQEPDRTITQTLIEHLENKQALLVLDNCEHVMDVCRDLVDPLLQTCKELRILATSRESLATLGERAYPVPPLSIPDPKQVPDPEALERFESIRLFVDRAKLVAPHFELTATNAPAAADICRHLDGIPLALELAAARVKVLSLEQIQEKLKNRFRLLTGGTKRTLAHHQTLRAAIDWSYELLSGQEQEFLRGSSVFAGGWTLEAATAVLGGELDEFEVLDLLTQLVDKSLAVADKDGADDRYRLLETIRQYGRERLDEVGKWEEASESHLHFFLDLAERAEQELKGPEQGAWLKRLENEHGNLVAALEWCRVREGGATTGLRLAGALWRFWDLHGHVGYGWSVMVAALGRAGAADPTEERAKALNGAGNLALTLADYVSARELYEEGLRIRRQLGDKHGVAGLLNNLGSLAWYQGNLSESRSLYEESLSIKREIGNKSDIASTLSNLGSVQTSMGDFSLAQTLHEESLGIYRELEDTQCIADVLHSLGMVNMYLGDLDRSRELHEESLRIEQELGNKVSTISPLINLASLATKAGEYDSAAPHLIEALELVREMGEKRHGAYALEAAAELAEARGESARSARLCGAAQVLRTEIGAPLTSPDQEIYDAVVSRVKDALGEESAATGWAEGRTMSYEEAADEVLQWLFDREA
jgi:non-specific serine/threonine protein kinase